MSTRNYEPSIPENSIRIRNATVDTTKRRIVLVEDEQITAQFIKSQLQEIGYEVLAIAASGEEAVKKIQTLRPDLVLMDIKLKGKMNGIEAAEKAHELYNVPVVYMTANADKQTVERAKQTQPCGFIYKPVHADALRTAIDMALYKHEMAQQVKEREARLEATLHSIGDAVVTTDTNSVITGINPVACRLTGWDEKDACGKVLTDVFHIVHAQTGKKEPNPVDRVLRKKITVSLPDHTMLISKAGREYKISDSAAPIKDRAGNLLGAVLVFRDVTEESRTQEVLQRTKEELETVFHDGPAMIYYTDQEGIILRVNQRFAGAMHKSQDELIGKRIDTVCPVFAGHLKKHENRVFKTGKPVNGVVINYDSDGVDYWLRSDLFPYKGHKGDTIGVVTFNLDITEAKQAENALYESEEKYRLISENIPVAVYSALADEKSTSVFISDGILEITGYSSRDFIHDPDLWKSIVHPEDRDFVWNSIDEHRRKKCTLDIEYRIITRSGQIKWVRDKASPLLDDNGTIVNIHGFFEDISKRKKAEDALLESEKLFRTVMENLPGEVFTHDMEGRIILVNRAACRNTGWSRKELLSMTVGDIDPESVTRKDREKLWKRLDNGEFSVLTATHIRKDGSTYPAEIYLNAVTIGGSPAILAISFDITERKLAEEKLKESEERFKKLSNVTFEGILIHDKGKVLDINESFVRIFGFSREELLGKDIADLMVPAEYRRVIFRNREEGFTKPYEIEARKKDGTIIPVEIEARNVQDGYEQFQVAAVRDITDRKLAEELIQRDLKEKEILLKEIHHRVKNNLTVISSLLNLQSKSITSKDDAMAAFEKSRDRIYSMARIHESLYKTEDFSRINMKPYIQTISNSLSHIYDPARRICFEIQCDNVFLDVTASIPCGLMINELITNSLKHGFQRGQKGKITVSLILDEDSMYVLSVRDTGVGLPGDFKISNAETMGMVLIRLLCEQLGGSLHVGSAPGSEFIIRFPRNRPE